jgi:Tfp pilus assembly protein PilN
MIKINLLPIRAARKRENIKQQLIIFAGLIALAAAALFFWYHSVSSTIKDRNKEIGELREEIAQLEREIGDVDKYKGLETELMTKLEVIDNLIKNKIGPVRVMDRLSYIIPRKVWLSKWEDRGGNVVVEGEALSNRDVGDFMEALAKPVDENAPSHEMPAAAESAQPGAAAASQPAPGSQPIDMTSAKASTSSKRYFTEIQLRESELKDEKSSGQPFTKFSLLLKVKYQL